MSHETFTVKVDRGSIKVTMPIATMLLVETEQRGDNTKYSVYNTAAGDAPPYILEPSEFKSLRERLENTRIGIDPLLWPVASTDKCQPCANFADPNNIPMPGCGPLGNPDEPEEIPEETWKYDNERKLENPITDEMKPWPDHVVAAMDNAITPVVLEEHDCVRFLEGDSVIRKGELGVIVHIYNDGEAYEVEVTRPLAGDEPFVVTVLPSQIRLDTIPKEVMDAADEAEHKLSWIGPDLRETLKKAEVDYKLKGDKK